MPKSLFRIKNVAIEGFKAFTKPQSFDLDGRHVFFFGENGLGKTSVVEAIRWCLFGLASRARGDNQESVLRRSVHRRVDFGGSRRDVVVPKAP